MSGPKRAEKRSLALWGVGRFVAGEGCTSCGVDQWRMLGSDSGFWGLLRTRTSPRGVHDTRMEGEGCGLEEGR